MTNKKNDKSFFIYTALIFFVALILIILSLFGQAHITQLNETTQSTMQPSETSPSVSSTPLVTNSLTERAAVISDYNRQLSEEIIDLKTQISNLEKDTKSLKSENDALSKQVTLNDLLLNANSLYQDGNTTQAKELLNGIDIAALSADQQKLYQMICE